MAEINPDQNNHARRLKQAVLAVQEMRARLAAMEQARHEPIAVIGLGCRFPGGADTPEEFWQLLRDQVDTITDIPADRWSLDDYYDPDPNAPGKIVSRYGGFLRQVDLFDARFFGIAPREAESLDPQHRLLLEVAWEALERAGIPPDTLAGSESGVFVGISGNEYYELLARRDPALIDAYMGSGNSHSIAAGRLSYMLGLEGPAMAVDTACSSSLVAVHLACQSLRDNECNLALAGGVNVLLTPTISINHSRAGMLSPGGRCRAFDDAADGFVRSEGCGLVVLRRLSDALRDGDPILALLRGSAINQDGRSNGLTAPNGSSQRALLRRAFRAAGIVPEELSYIEAHGTGTSLGDPIELGALKELLNQRRCASSASNASQQRCWVGSVKTNLGHLEAAAGIAGLIKVVLALGQRHIPAHLHFKRLNRHISLEGSRLEIPTALTPWPAPPNRTDERATIDHPCEQKPRRLAGVSSFGFGGTNAHVILEEAPFVLAERTSLPSRRSQLLTLSAKSSDALTALVRAYIKLLTTHEKPPASESFSLEEICAAANIGRSHFAFRLATVSESKTQLRDQLEEFSRGKGSGSSFFSNHAVSDSGTSNAAGLRIGFLFSGQGGSALEGCGRELFDSEPVFRSALEHCSEVLDPLLEVPLLKVLFPVSERGSVSPFLLQQRAAYTQPSLFALQYALGELWKSWGIEPAVVLGHSFGEYAAACAAGLFRMEEALRLVARRGQLLDEHLPRKEQRGGMAVLFASRQQVDVALETYAQQNHRHGRVAVAVINGPQNVVVSGDRHALDSLCQRFAGLGMRSQFLEVTHGFHSPVMEPVLPELQKAADAVTYNQPQADIISCLHGRRASMEEMAQGAYWRRHLREPVEFFSAMKAFAREGLDAVIEIGPRPMLLALGRQCFARCEASEQEQAKALRAPPLWLASLPRGTSGERQHMLEAMAQLYTAGARPRWEGLLSDQLQTQRQLWRRSCALLPTYPFERQRHWPASVVEQQKKNRPPNSFSVPAVAEVDSAAISQAPPAASNEAGLYELLWEPQPLSARAVLSSASPEGPASASSSARVFCCSRWLVVVADDQPPRTTEEERQTGPRSRAQLLAAQVARSLGELHPLLKPTNPDKSADSDHDCRVLGMQDALRALGENDSLFSEVEIHDPVSSLNQSDGRQPTPERLEVVVLCEPSLGLRNMDALLERGEVPQHSSALCESVLSLMQVLIRQRGQKRSETATAAKLLPRLWLLTRCAVTIEEEQTQEEETATERARLLGLLQAPLWGLGRVFALEAPELWGGLIDLSSPNEDSGHSGSLLTLRVESEAIVTELLSGAGEDQVALRLFATDAQNSHDDHGPVCKRFVARLRSHPAQHSGPQPQTPGARCRSDGVYLITGGLGALGLACARFLVEQGARYLLLSGRHASPSSLSPRQMRVLEELANAGACVRMLSADVADHLAMEHGLQLSMEAFGRDDQNSRPLALRGIIHAAGVAGNPEPLEAISARELGAVLRAKVHGSWVLHELSLKEPKLELFVTFSSIASLWGSRNQGSYAAANAFLDGLAQYRRRVRKSSERLLPALDINWGPWNMGAVQPAEAQAVTPAVNMDQTWQQQEDRTDGGMAGAAARRWLSQSGVESLSVTQGLNAFAQLLDLQREARPPTQVTVARVNWERLCELFELRMPRAFLQYLRPAGARLTTGSSDVALAPAPSFLSSPSAAVGDSTPALKAGSFLRKVQQASAAERPRLLSRLVQEQVAAIMGFSEPGAVAPATGFFELGMDSIMALELKQRLQKILDLSLRPTLAFDWPCAEVLGRHLNALLSSPDTVPPKPSQSPSPETSRLDNLSEEEAEALLLQKIELLSESAP